MKMENDIVTRTDEAKDRKFRWWSDFLFNGTSNSRLEQQIMDRVQNELRNYQNPAIDRYNHTVFSSIYLCFGYRYSCYGQF